MRRFIAATAVALIAGVAGTATATADTGLAGNAPSVEEAVLGAVATVSPAPLTLVATVANAEGSLEFVSYRADTAADVRGGVARAQTQGQVLSLAVDHMVALSEPDAAAVVAQPTVQSDPSANDPFRSMQWALDAVGYEAQWAHGNGSGVTVAVIDTGVFSAHEDAPDHLAIGHYFLHDRVTYAPLEGTGAPGDHYHGSHVAGIIAAATNNWLGVTGAAPGATILPVKVLDSSGAGWNSDVAAGIVWAVDNGADVINLSLGSAGDADASVHSAVEYAYGHGVVVFAAAGNSGCDVNGGAGASCPAVWPAAEAHVISVGSVGSYDPNLGRYTASSCSDFTTRAGYVDVAAPGAGIYSLGVFNNAGVYAAANGTSMATPYAAAAAALLLSYNPALTPDQVANLLESAATDVQTAGLDTCTGHGLINPSAAAAAAPVPATTTTSSTAPATTTTTAGATTTLPTTTTAVPAGSFTVNVTRNGSTFSVTGSTGTAQSQRCVTGGRCQARWVTVTQPGAGRGRTLARARLGADGTYNLSGLAAAGPVTVTVTGLGSKGSTLS